MRFCNKVPAFRWEKIAVVEVLQIYGTFSWEGGGRTMSRSIALVRCTGVNLTPVSAWISLRKLNATIAAS